MKIEHEYTDNIVCPHCGYENESSWELNMSDGDKEEMVCGSCDKVMTVYCEITVKYSTEKVVNHDK